MATSLDWSGPMAATSSTGYRPIYPRDILTRLSIVVARAPGSGKTTLLSCCAAGLDPSLRVVIVEKVCEADIPLSNVTEGGYSRCEPVNTRGRLSALRPWHPGLARPIWRCSAVVVASLQDHDVVALDPVDESVLLVDAA